ncbi:MAG: hypothetical protein IT373_25305 [Polyangiaceae bacterium]|nr:hypothetical protein [Polyangiaceae bacterium]
MKLGPGRYRVGVRAAHAATAEHHVARMALYRNGAVVAELPPDPHGISGHTVTFDEVALEVGDELVAVLTCNLHGRWGRRLRVEGD